MFSSSKLRKRRCRRLLFLRSTQFLLRSLLVLCIGIFVLYYLFFVSSEDNLIYVWGSRDDIKKVLLLYNKALVAAADLGPGADFNGTTNPKVEFSEYEDNVTSSACAYFVNELSCASCETKPFVVYLTTMAAERFTYHCLLQSQIPGKRSFVLVTGCADESASTSFFTVFLNSNSVLDLERIKKSAPLTALLSHPRLLRWYAQGCDVSHPKVTCLPLGVDYHTLVRKTGDLYAATRQENKLLEILRQRGIEEKQKQWTNPSAIEAKGIVWQRPTDMWWNAESNISLIPPGDPPRQRRVYVAFRTHTNRALRGPLRQHFKKLPFAVIAPHCEGQEAFLNTLTRMTFVASPPGNGYDCHRTWEAIATGSIPIVQHPEMRKNDVWFHPPVYSTQIESVKLWQSIHSLTDFPDKQAHLNSIRLLNRSRAVELFEKMPVVIVKDYYREVNEERLVEWEKEIREKWKRGEYDLRRLRTDYWLGRIRRGE